MSPLRIEPLEVNSTKIARKEHQRVGFSHARPFSAGVGLAPSLEDLEKKWPKMSKTTRDFEAEFQDNSDRNYQYDFDHTIRRYLLERLAPFMSPDKPVLELGAYKGDMTAQILEYYPSIDVIEASESLALEVQKRFGERVRVTNALFENAEISHPYNNIFLVHTLEHLDDPVESLKRIASWLSDDGKLFVAVPNANALSRQIAVRMGLISHNAAVTPGEFQHGHRRTYSLDVFLDNLRNAGLKVIDHGGVIVKPLANYQFDEALKQGIISEDFVSACDELAKTMPDLSASVFAVCTRDDS